VCPGVNAAAWAAVSGWPGPAAGWRGARSASLPAARCAGRDRDWSARSSFFACRGAAAGSRFGSGRAAALAGGLWRPAARPPGGGFGGLRFRVWGVRAGWRGGTGTVRRSWFRGGCWGRGWSCSRWPGLGRLGAGGGWRRARRGLRSPAGSWRRGALRGSRAVRPRLLAGSCWRRSVPSRRRTGGRPGTAVPGTSMAAAGAVGGGRGRCSRYPWL
jgi:hypothetical protein